MDMLINVANLLYVVAYFTNNMLRLRLLTLAAAACLAIYFATRPEPLWTVVGWNIFFLLLNLAQLLRLLLAVPPRNSPGRVASGFMPPSPATSGMLPRQAGLRGIGQQ
jgi:hypothetical protein